LCAATPRCESIHVYEDGHDVSDDVRLALELLRQGCLSPRVSDWSHGWCHIHASGCHIHTGCHHLCFLLQNNVVRSANPACHTLRRGC
jgi:hypothetical protein